MKTLEVCPDTYATVAPELPYHEFLVLQRNLTAKVRIAPRERHFLFCSHPVVVTEGRGDRQNGQLGLRSRPPTGVEVVAVNRGGGLTLHYPGQLIIYPVVRLTASFGFNDYLLWLQRLAIRIVGQRFGIVLEPKRNPLGLWKNGKKYASIGIGIDRFITNHGLALNVEAPPIDITSLAPCGLGADRYSYLQAIEPKADTAGLFSFITNDISILSRV